MIGLMVPGGLQLIELKRAGWTMATRDGFDPNIMDGLIEKVERQARHNVLRRALAEGANDDAKDPP